MMSGVRGLFASQPKVMRCCPNPDVNNAVSRCTILENTSSPISEVCVHSKTAAFYSLTVNNGRLTEYDTAKRIAF